MKKILVLVLALSILLGCMNLVAFAETNLNTDMIDSADNSTIDEYGNEIVGEVDGYDIVVINGRKYVHITQNSVTGTYSLISDRGHLIAANWPSNQMDVFTEYQHNRNITFPNLMTDSYWTPVVISEGHYQLGIPSEGYTCLPEDFYILLEEYPRVKEISLKRESYKRGQKDFDANSIAFGQMHWREIAGKLYSCQHVFLVNEEVPCIGFGRIGNKLNYRDYPLYRGESHDDVFEEVIGPKKDKEFKYIEQPARMIKDIVIKGTIEAPLFYSGQFFALTSDEQTWSKFYMAETDPEKLGLQETGLQAPDPEYVHDGYIHRKAGIGEVIWDQYAGLTNVDVTMVIRPEAFEVLVDNAYYELEQRQEEYCLENLPLGIGLNMLHEMTEKDGTEYTAAKLYRSFEFHFKALDMIFCNSVRVEYHLGYFDPNESQLQGGLLPWGKEPDPVKPDTTDTKETDPDTPYIPDTTTDTTDTTDTTECPIPCIVKKIFWTAVIWLTPCKK